MHPQIDRERTWLARQKLRAVALAGPAANLIAGALQWQLGSKLDNHVQLSNTAEGYVITLSLVQLALGISNLLPQKGSIFGNDGNIIFRVCRNDASYERAVKAETGVFSRLC
jgi:hypothetical protein